MYQSNDSNFVLLIQCTDKDTFSKCLLLRFPIIFLRGIEKWIFRNWHFKNISIENAVILYL